MNTQTTILRASRVALRHIFFASLVLALCAGAFGLKFEHALANTIHCPVGSRKTTAEDARELKQIFAANPAISASPFTEGSCLPKELVAILGLNTGFSAADAVAYLGQNTCADHQRGYKPSETASLEKQVYFSAADSSGRPLSLTADLLRCSAMFMKDARDAGLSSCVSRGLRTTEHQKALCEEAKKAGQTGVCGLQTDCKSVNHCLYVQGTALDIKSTNGKQQGLAQFARDKFGLQMGGATDAQGGEKSASDSARTEMPSGSDCKGRLTTPDLKRTPTDPASERAAVLKQLRCLLLGNCDEKKDPAKQPCPQGFKQAQVQGQAVCIPSDQTSQTKCPPGYTLYAGNTCYPDQQHTMPPPRTMTPPPMPPSAPPPSATQQTPGTQPAPNPNTTQPNTQTTSPFDPSQSARNSQKAAEDAAQKAEQDMLNKIAKSNEDPFAKQKKEGEVDLLSNTNPDKLSGEGEKLDPMATQKVEPVDELLAIEGKKEDPGAKDKEKKDEKSDTFGSQSDEKKNEPLISAKAEIPVTTAVPPGEGGTELAAIQRLLNNIKSALQDAAKRICIIVPMECTQRALRKDAAAEEAGNADMKETPPNEDTNMPMKPTEEGGASPEPPEEKTAEESQDPDSGPPKKLQ